MLTLRVEGTQARDERAWIATAVRVMFADERAAARVVRLVLVHPSSSTTVASRTV